MGTCMCGKAKYTEQIALRIIKNKNDMKGHYKCPLSDTYHVSKTKKKKSSSYGYGHHRFKFNKNRILRELREEMATRKAIRERIIEYMRDSYERNKTIKFSSQMVTFAVQQELGSINKQVIAEEISRLKTKTKIIVSLNEKVPDQRGAVYFTLAEILEKETDPNNVTEPKIIPQQVVIEKPKPIPVNPFDKVHEKLDDLKEAVSNSEVTLEDEDHKKIAEIVLGGLNEHIHTLFGDIVNRINEVKQIASSHVTVDGDKLADVINARLQNLKLGDSLIYAVRKESRGAIEPVWDATKAVNDQTVKLSQTIQERIPNIKEEVDNVIDARLGQYTDMILDKLNTIKVPKEVSNEDDYRAGIKDGIKDGIRMALEMGLKLDD